MTEIAEMKRKSLCIYERAVGLLTLSLLLSACAGGIDKGRCPNYDEDTSRPLHVARADKGKRSSDDVRKIVDKHRLDIYRLFNKRVKQNPCLAGKIAYRLTINAGGTAERVQIVASSTSDAIFDKQLAKLLKTYEYGKIDDPLDVSVVGYEMIFNRN